ncbi:hypothetical protein [Plastoroseomonas arctica]|uniref:Uncharacterized protein n=1 Tax=Plastoroseomonas arctica TaxID=1509237 RepID=A0AAF1JXE6_9PROT|nr:hypothetical protein [Plastoroseomonas arctica]MBR0656101.1 hypothetical protein [Plastoroseomonas arctica]
MARGPRPSKAKPAGKPGQPKPDAAAATLERLSREVEETRAKLRQVEEQGLDAFTAKKIETLIEAAQIARGQALDAALERTKAQGELRALRDAIEKAPGPAGWLMRRALRRL